MPRDRLWPDEALLWETAWPYLYARTTSDARVLVGGADSGGESEPSPGRAVA